MTNFENVKKILNGQLTFNFKSANESKTIKIEDIPEESLAVILDYGTRKLNDMVNSAFAGDKNTKSREQIVEEVWSKLIQGTIGLRQNVDTELRDFTIDLLKNNGIPSDMLKNAKKQAPIDILRSVYPDDEEESLQNKLHKIKGMLAQQKALFDGFSL